MNKLDNEIIRSARRLAQKECANYADGLYDDGQRGSY